MKRIIPYIFCFIACMSQLYAADLIVDELKNQEVYFVNFLFSDLLGNLKEVLIPVDHVQDALENGITFDGSSVAGCSNISESDMLLKPDINTTRIVPWLQGINKTAIMICDLYLNQNKPFADSPRTLLKNVTQEIAQHGFTCNVGPELEFFILDKDNNPIDNNNYFNAETNIKRTVQNGSLIHILKAMGIDVEKLHHEVASGQHEFSIKYGDPVAIADQVILAKYTLKSITQEYGHNVTFMPKPFADQNGSAMHIHFSLWDIMAQQNAFYNEQDNYKFSKIGKQFLAGVLHHMPSTTAIFNPTINSYKRLVPGYEAPIYICWGTKNRSALIRLPESNGPNSVRAELRCPDAMCNPYLAFAALLKSGLDGIIHERTEPKPAEENLYTLTKQQLTQHEIASLPTNLAKALDNLQNSSFVQKLFGDTLMQSFVGLKNKELYAYNTHISDWERKTYL